MTRARRSPAPAPAEPPTERIRQAIAADWCALATLDALTGARGSDARRAVGVVMGAVTITLPGPPVAYAVPLDAFPRYLLAHGWVPELGGYKPGRECTWRHESGGQYIRSPGADDCDLPGQLAYMITAAAKQMGIEASALAALLVEGPALQWAHASADTRAPVLALLDSEAADSRHNARVAREEGKTAEALSEDGRAMAHEAAAAVLRGGGR